MRASVSHIAAALTAATGNAVVRTDFPGGSVRLEVVIPSDIKPIARRVILHALADADGFGHSRTGGTEHVWAIIDAGSGT